MDDQRSIKLEHQETHHHADRCDHNKRNLDRIRRIRGQLESLERLIAADEGSCEERVIRARTIEKGVTSLITHLVECYIENTAKLEMTIDPEKASKDLARIVQLLNNIEEEEKYHEKNMFRAGDQLDHFHVGCCRCSRFPCRRTEGTRGSSFHGRHD